MSVAAMLLAAGRGSRFGATEDDTKLVADLDGMPLVRRVAVAALASRASPVVVVTGHAAVAVERALAGLPLRFVHNRDYADGLARTLAAGIAALPIEAAGALVLLADMPLVRPQTLDRLIGAFAGAAEGTDAVVPVFAGRRGNPVLIGRRLFASLAGLRGDAGAKTILDDPARTILPCAVDDPGIAIDVDTRDALQALAREA